MAGTAGLATLVGAKHKLAGVPQDRHQVLPLGPPVGRFTPLPIGAGASNKRLRQAEDKPQVG